MESISELAEQIKACENCPLHHSRTNVVPGEGSKDAKILFVGEAPGQQEDETGRPFVGRSGQMLRKLAKQAGIDTISDSSEKDKNSFASVFITNVVKCRPPKNRNPKASELNACRPWLDMQLEALNPKVIVPLGNFGCKILLGETGITAMRGRCFERAGIKYCPTFHPAAALRDPRRRPLILKDLKRAKELSEISSPKQQTLV